jgi:hypothetical protein
VWVRSQVPTKVLFFSLNVHINAKNSKYVFVLEDEQYFKYIVLKFLLIKLLLYTKPILKNIDAFLLMAIC